MDADIALCLRAVGPVEARREAVAPGEVEERRLEAGPVAVRERTTTLALS